MEGPLKISHNKGNEMHESKMHKSKRTVQIKNVVHPQLDACCVQKVSKRQYLHIKAMDYLVKISTLLSLLFPVGRTATKKQRIMKKMKIPIKTFPNWFGFQ